MQKIGFIIPWYGENKPGGMERELRALTTQLQLAGLEVEVITTCIKDFRGDWNQNYYATGTAFVDDISVRRFPVRQRDARAYDRIVQKMEQGYRLSLVEEQTFIEESINSPRLYEYLREAVDNYALYVFWTYSFGTTYFGMQICPEKSVLIPCFRDEPAMRLRLFRQEYVQAKGMIYHAIPEMELAGRLYDFSATQQICIGSGMQTKIEADGTAFRTRYHIEDPFLLYVGRRDEEKNVRTLLRYFAEWKRRQPDSPLKLVLIGDNTGTVQIPASVQETVYDLGFLTEQEKYEAMTAAEILCQPAEQERFSTAIMESWLCGRPVLVHAKCAVTREFAKKANGGLYFRDYFEFEGGVRYLLDHPEAAKQMGENGKAYVEQYFSWQTILEKYCAFFEKLIR